MAMRNRNPSEPRRGDEILLTEMSSFKGMISGEPGIRIPNRAGNPFSQINENVVDHGDYFDIRGGTKQYTSTPVGYKFHSYGGDNALQVDDTIPWRTGDVVYFFGPELPATITADIPYYYRYSLTIEDAFTIHPTRDDAFDDTNVVAVGDDIEEGNFYIYIGKANAFCDHTKAEKLIFLFGNQAWVSDKSINIFDRIINLSNINPSGISTIVPMGEFALLSSKTGGLFKIVFGEDFDYMFPINNSGPTTLIPDDNETEAKKYGYLYIHSVARLTGAGNRNRVTDGVLLLSETGTTVAPEKDYGEVYFESEVGLDITTKHIVGLYDDGDLIVDRIKIKEYEGRGMTHIPLYRTKNIGVNSGGTSPDANGLGNLRDFMIWVDDIPICKSFKVSIDGTYNKATIISGNKFVRGDVGSTLTLVYGNTGNRGYYEITEFIDEDNVYIDDVLGTSPPVTTAECFAVIGGLRVAKASQSSHFLTVDTTVSIGGLARGGDDGIILFVSDGTIRHVEYVYEEEPAGSGILSFYVAESEDFTDLAIGFQGPNSGTNDVVYRRAWNDTFPDRPQADGRVSWDDRKDFPSQIYIPRRFFRPLPNADIIYSSDGFLVSAERDSAKYSYCSTGDRQWNVGQYKFPEQERNITGSITHVIGFPFKAVILCKNQTGVLTLNSAQNIGRTQVGENIFLLPELSIVDTLRGVVAWNLITYKNQNLIFALTNESAFRYFDGIAWSKNDFAYQNGLDAVSKSYFNKIDHSLSLGANYNSKGGIKIWARDGAGEIFCLRFATEAGEGVGWSLMSGDAWVEPIDYFGVFTIIDANDIQRVIVLDRNDLNFYEMDTFDRISNTKKYPLDKEDVDGVEIAWSKKLRGMDVDPSTRYQAVGHESTQLIVSPEDTANRGVVGYTASGQRAAQELTLKMYVNGEVISKAAEASDFPESGEVVFTGRRQHCQSFILELVGTASEIIVRHIANKFLGIAKAPSRANRTMTEHTLQRELATDLVLHICRNKTIKNRVTGADLGGGTVTTITGPDGRSNSGVQFSQNVTLDNPALATYTIVMWSKEASTSLISGLTSWTALGAAVSGWQMFYKKNTNLAANKTLVLGNKFGVRIYSKTISDDALALLREDTADFAGKMLLPGF